MRAVGMCLWRQAVVDVAASLHLLEDVRVQVRVGGRLLLGMLLRLFGLLAGLRLRLGHRGLGFFGFLICGGGEIGLGLLCWLHLCCSFRALNLIFN